MKSGPWVTTASVCLSENWPTEVEKAFIVLTMTMGLMIGAESM